MKYGVSGGEKRQGKTFPSFIYDEEGAQLEILSVVTFTQIPSRQIQNYQQEDNPEVCSLILNSSSIDSGCVREDLAQLPTVETAMVLQHSKTHTGLKVSWKTETKFGVRK